MKNEPKDEQIVVRLEKQLMRDVDRFAARLAKKTGLQVSRGAAVRRLLTIALKTKGAE